MKAPRTPSEKPSLTRLVGKHSCRVTSTDVVIPWAVHMHLPFVQSHPDVNIDLIYAPTLHNGLAWVRRLGAVSRSLEFEVSADLANVRLAETRMAGGGRERLGAAASLGRRAEAQVRQLRLRSTVVGQDGSDLLYLTA